MDMEEVMFERTSVQSGITRQKTFKVNPLKLKYWEEKRMCIQDAFPHLTSNDREFILTGMTEEEWDEAFKEELRI